MRTYDNGVVKSVSFSSPAIGGTASFVLHETRLAPLGAGRPASLVD